MKQGLSRRAFLVRLTSAGSLLLPALNRRLAAASRPAPGPHPTPRPGITSEKVLTKEQLAETPKLIELFDQVREIPEVVDGIRCQCGCADLPGNYSLLSCYEGDAMARHCPICQGEARMAYRLHKDRKSLDEIRASIDSRYG